MPENVQLTRINVYNEKQCQIYSISRNLERGLQHDPRVIKRNIFGHKWVFKISNHPRKKKKTSWKLYVYIVVSLCILVAIFSGLYFTFEKRIKNLLNDDAQYIKNVSITKTNEEIKRTHNFTEITETTYFERDKVTVLVPNITNVTLENSKNEIQLCNCLKNEVCLKMDDISKPSCVKIKDDKDPTGCGGYCIINIEICKVLDNSNKVHQCIKTKHKLDCPKNNFNCGNMCIPEGKRCDGVVHCLGKTDELNCECNLTTHFQCGTETSCLLQSKKCDGVVDCWDKSDEKDCVHHNCNETQELPCDNGQCIPKESFCDGILHCNDKSDEPSGCQQ